MGATSSVRRIRSLAARYPESRPPREGQYLLRLSGTATSEVLACEGVAGCEGAVFHSEDLEVSVLP
jgi:hypothetical protein